MNKTIQALTLSTAMALCASGVAAQVANPLSDVRVRKAIAYAIDMDTIVETLFQGQAIVADSMIPNGAWKVEGLNPYAYDPDQARALLEEAGWDEDYVLDVVFYYGDQLTIDLMTVLQHYLGDVGIQMTYRKLEGDVSGQLNIMPEDGSDVSAVIWDMAYGAKAALAMQEYYNGYAEGFNSYTPTHPERSELIERINGSADIDVQVAAFHDFETFENEHLSDIALYYQQVYIFESDRVNRSGGIYGNEQFNYDWGILNWEVEPDENGRRVLHTNRGPIQFFAQPWLNPGLTTGAKVLFDRLLTADGSLLPSGPQLAEGWDVSEDGLSVTFDLIDDATWHDGTPLTAADVAFSIELAVRMPTLNAVFANTFTSLEGADAFLNGEADSISGIVADGDSLTLSFAVLDPNLLITFSQFPPLPQHLLADANPLEFQQHPFWQSPVGSGPFRIGEVQMNDFARFVPYEGYYGGTAAIDEIVAFPSDDVDLNVVRNAAAGRLDYGFSKSVVDALALMDMEHMTVTPADIPYTRSLRINSYAFQPE